MELPLVLLHLIYTQPFIVYLMVQVVSVINSQTNQVTGSISVGSYPSGLAINPNTGTVYVTNSGGGTVSVISPSTPAQIILAPFQTPQPKSSQTQQVAPVANADCIL